MRLFRRPAIGILVATICSSAAAAQTPALSSLGIVWLADDGSVVRTRLEVTDPLKGLRALMIVDYRPEPKLDMLVPTTMHETYIATGANAERVECNARYSGFRRFETAARMVPDR